MKNLKAHLMTLCGSGTACELKHEGVTVDETARGATNQFLRPSLTIIHKMCDANTVTR